MGFTDYCILFALAAWGGAALRYVWKRRKSGCGCHCAACPHCGRCPR